MNFIKRLLGFGRVLIKSSLYGWDEIFRSNSNRSFTSLVPDARYVYFRAHFTETGLTDNASLNETFFLKLF